MKTLYQEIEAQVDVHLPQDWHLELRGRLFMLLMGIILAKSCSPRRMAKALYQYGYSDAQETSLERQMRRIENDSRLSAQACVHPFARHHLRFGKPGELTLIIDPTTHTDKIVMLMVSVRYRGRSLPLAWDIWPANVPLKGAGFWARVEQLLAIVADLLPPNIPITWLADRAFGTPQFTDLLQPYGWYFIVRVQGQTRWRDCLGRERRIDSLVKRQGRRAKRQAEAFKKADWRRVSIVVYWSHQHKSPLCLVSNLKLSWHLISFYRFRYNIEAMFRDYKSQGWHWENSQVYDLAHTQVLLVGMALATWLTLMLGTQVAHEHLSRVPTGKRSTPPKISQSSIFQMGLERLQQWAVNNLRHPLAFWLSDWQAPNWKVQLTQHHRLAYIMGTISSIVKLQHYLNATVRP